MLALWSGAVGGAARGGAGLLPRNIFPLVTPQAMDPAHPFPFISNLSLNLLVTLHHEDDPQPVLARVKVPLGKGVPRFCGSAPAPASCAWRR